MFPQRSTHKTKNTLTYYCTKEEKMDKTLNMYEVVILVILDQVMKIFKCNKGDR